MKIKRAGEHELLAEEAFWNQFELDIGLVQSRLIIQSGFIASRRVRLLQALLEPLIRRNVQVCAFIQKPDLWDMPLARLSSDGATKLKATSEDIDVLQRLGVHVNLVTKVHMKFAILDEAVFYEGSLNILSHNSSLEGMRRFASVEETRKKVRQERFLDCHSCKELLHKHNFLCVQKQLFAMRKKKNLTQRELSELSGIAQSQIARMETLGEARLGSFCRLSGALDCHLVALPGWVLPSIANLFAKLDNHELLDALQDENLTPEREWTYAANTDFTPPNQIMKVKEVANSDEPLAQMEENAEAAFECQQS